MNLRQIGSDVPGSLHTGSPFNLDDGVSGKIPQCRGAATLLIAVGLIALPPVAHNRDHAFHQHLMAGLLTVQPMRLKQQSTIIN